jgi:hypothetical protein
MSYLHRVLFGVGLCIVTALLASLSSRRYQISSLIKFVLTAPIIVLILIQGLLYFQEHTLSYGGKDYELNTLIEKNQQGGMKIAARAQYIDKAEIKSMTELFFQLPVIFFQYLFEPMPWRVSALADIPLVFENIFRAWLIWYALLGFIRLPSQGRGPVRFIFLSYLGMEGIWSLGTINWGTAMRHHLPSLGMLVLAAIPYLGYKAKLKEAKKLARMEMVSKP